MSLNPQSPLSTSPRSWLALIVAFVVLSMTGALYFQHVLGLAPCPLCVLQRVAIIGVGLAAALGLLVAGARAQLLAATLAIVLAVVGGGIAAWHSWILAFPPESMTCGRPFQWFHEDFPLVQWLPKLFRGDGDCLAVDWTLLGLAIPHLSLLAFVALLVMAAAAARLVWHGLR